MDSICARFMTSCSDRRVSNNPGERDARQETAEDPWAEVMLIVTTFWSCLRKSSPPRAPGCHPAVESAWYRHARLRSPGNLECRPCRALHETLRGRVVERSRTSGTWLKVPECHHGQQAPSLGTRDSLKASLGRTGQREDLPGNGQPAKGRTGGRED